MLQGLRRIWHAVIRLRQNVLRLPLAKGPEFRQPLAVVQILDDERRPQNLFLGSYIR